MQKIASFNFKGGVGKTTIAVQLAHGLAKSNINVLLVDLDTQNNCSLFLGIDREEIKNTFYEFVTQPSIKIKDCIIEARENLDLMVSNDYDEINALFSTKIKRHDLIFDELLSDLDYDYIIIDCSPSKNLVNDAILHFVNHLIVPIQPEIASIEGISQIFDYLEKLRLPVSKVKLIVPNMMDLRTNEHKQNLEKLKKAAGEDIVAEPIKRRIKIAEATSQGKTIFEYNTKAQKQFYGLLERVIDIE